MRVLVVGAGVAGLQTARALVRHGIQVVVLEENEDVGGVWLRNFAGYGLQVPWEMYQFPEYPYVRKVELNTYPTGQQVREYIQAYARHFNLYQHCLFNCRLIRLGRTPAPQPPPTEPEAPHSPANSTQRHQHQHQVRPTSAVVGAASPGFELLSSSTMMITRATSNLTGTACGTPHAAPDHSPGLLRAASAGPGTLPRDPRSSGGRKPWTAGAPPGGCEWYSGQSAGMAASQDADAAATTLRGSTASTAAGADAAAGGGGGPAGQCWVALYEDLCTGRMYRLEADFVVLATGLYASPFIPSVPGQALYRGLQVHSRNFTDARAAAGKAVLVVGGGKTALDCVGELSVAAEAKSVTLLYRRPHWPLPRKVGCLSMKRLVYNRCITAALPAYYAASRRARLAAVVLTPGRKLFWTSLMAGVNRKLGIKRTVGRPDRPICQDIWYSGQVLELSWPEMLANTKVTHVQGELDHFTPVSVVLKDGQELQPDVVLYATGYSATYPFLDQELQDRLGMQYDGLYLYRSMLSPDLPRMAFVGAEVSTFNNILTSGLQAEWLAGLLARRVALPPREAMAADVRAQMDWKRAVMPPHKLRGSAVMLYQQSYHDQLMKDLGLPRRRKAEAAKSRGGMMGLLSRPFVECIDPYRASDYNGIFDATAASAVAAAGGTPGPWSVGSAAQVGVGQDKLPAARQSSVRSPLELVGSNGASSGARGTHTTGATNTTASALAAAAGAGTASSAAPTGAAAAAVGGQRPSAGPAAGQGAVVSAPGAAQARQSSAAAGGGGHGGAGSGGAAAAAGYGFGGVSVLGDDPQGTLYDLDGLLPALKQLYRHSLVDSHMAGADVPSTAPTSGNNAPWQQQRGSRPTPLPAQAQAYRSSRAATHEGLSRASPAPACGRQWPAPRAAAAPAVPTAGGAMAGNPNPGSNRDLDRLQTKKEALRVSFDAVAAVGGGSTSLGCPGTATPTTTATATATTSVTTTMTGTFSGGTPAQAQPSRGVAKVVALAAAAFATASRNSSNGGNGPLASPARGATAAGAASPSNGSNGGIKRMFSFRGLLGGGGHSSKAAATAAASAAGGAGSSSRKELAGTPDCVAVSAVTAARGGGSSRKEGAATAAAASSTGICRMTPSSQAVDDLAYRALPPRDLEEQLRQQAVAAAAAGASTPHAANAGNATPRRAFGTAAAAAAARNSSPAAQRLVAQQQQRAAPVPLATGRQATIPLAPPSVESCNNQDEDPPPFAMLDTLETSLFSEGTSMVHQHPPAAQAPKLPHSYNMPAGAPARQQQLQAAAARGEQHATASSGISYMPSGSTLVAGMPQGGGEGVGVSGRTMPPVGVGYGGAPRAHGVAFGAQAHAAAAWPTPLHFDGTTTASSGISYMPSGSTLVAAGQGGGGQYGLPPAHLSAGAHAACAHTQLPPHPNVHAHGRAAGPAGMNARGGAPAAAQPHDLLSETQSSGISYVPSCSTLVGGHVPAWMAAQLHQLPAMQQPSPQYGHHAYPAHEHQMHQLHQLRAGAESQDELGNVLATYTAFSGGLSGAEFLMVPSVPGGPAAVAVQCSADMHSSSAAGPA